MFWEQAGASWLLFHRYFHWARGGRVSSNVLPKKSTELQKETFVSGLWDALGRIQVGCIAVSVTSL